MKCQKCEQELPGAAVICRDCGFNNALQGISNWRHKRDQMLSPRTSAPGTRTAPRNPGDATLIRFPVSAEKAAAEPAEWPTNSDLPAWRRQLNEKVRQVRAQRNAEATRSNHADEPDASDVNPIVAAAIKRIRRDLPPPASSSSMSGATGATSGMNGGTTAQATARALACKEQPTMQPEAKPEQPAPAPQKKQTLSATLPGLSPPVARTASNESVAPRKTEIIPVSTLLQAAQAVEAESLTRPVAHSETVGQSASLVEEISAAELSEGKDRSAHPAPGSDLAGSPTLTYGSSGKAPFLARVAATIIDLEVIAFSFLPFFTAFTLFNAEFSRSSMYALTGLAMVMTFIYHLLSIRIAGRTFGMAVFRIRVADAADESVPLTLNQTLRRAAGAVVSLALIPLNLIVIMLSPERQSLSDQLSGTTVVRQ